MNGYNDNPMATQFISAYRKMLLQCDILISETSNVSSIGTSNVLTVSSLTKGRPNSHQDNDYSGEVHQIPSNGMATERSLHEWHENMELEFLQNNYITDHTHDAGIAYIASALERRLTTSSQIYCTLCRDVLIKNEKVDEKICVGNNNKPCLSSFQLCKLTDTAVKIYINTGPSFKQKIYIMVMNHISWSDIYPEFYEPLHDSDHKHFLVKFIIDEYINKKCSFVAKQTTIASQKKYIRNKMRKIGHNLHQ